MCPVCNKRTEGIRCCSSQCYVEVLSYLIMKFNGLEEKQAGLEDYKLNLKEVSNE
jgi:hypothetical protein